jgi:hypothetical protein
LECEIRLPGQTILTGGEARKLASRLTKAAAELDGWVAR